MIKYVALFRVTFVSLILLTITPVHADAGLPMLVIMWPLFALSFIPIVVIEAYVLRRLLANLAWKQAIKVSIYTNLVSTLLGVPLTWGALVGLEFLTTRGQSFSKLSLTLKYVIGVILEAPWLTHEEQFYWMIPTASMVLLFFFFLVSGWSESLFAQRLLKASHNGPKVKKAVWRANMASYALLYITMAIWLVYTVLLHKI